MKIIGPMAGIGARLRPFTYNKPKALLKVAGKRVINHILDLFKEVAEKKTKLLLITGYQNRRIKNHLKTHYSDYFDIEFTLQEPKGYIGDIPYYGGLGQAVYLSKDWYKQAIDGNYNSEDPDDFAMIFLSDMVPLDGYNQFIEISKGNLDKVTFNDKEYAVSDVDGIIGVMQVPKERAKNYGIVELESNSLKIKNMVEKPKKFISNLAIAGVYVFKPHTMKQLYNNLNKEIEKKAEKDGEVQITPALKDLLDQGLNLIALPFQKGILDFGNTETLLEGNRYLLENNGKSLTNSIFKEFNSSIIFPYFIDKKVEVKNSVIGPYCSIGENCFIKECILKNCVIGDNCVLEKIISSNSIIGDNVIMEDLIKDDLIIGDHSSIRSSKNKV